MNLLASVLPGVRELRAPLTVGYISLAALWILGAFATEPNVLTELQEPLLRATAAWGEPVMLAAASLTAYLLGIVIGSLPGLLLVPLRTGGRAIATFAATPVLLPIAISDQNNRSRARATKRFFSTFSTVEPEAEVLARDRYSHQRTAVRWSYLEETISGTLTTRTQIESFISGLDDGSQRRLERFRSMMRSPASAPVLIPVSLQRGGRRRLTGETTDSQERWAICQVLGLEKILDQEIRDLPARLAIHATPAYERWDRLQSEAQFRQQSAFAIFLLGISLVLTDLLPLVALLAVGVGFLVLTGEGSRKAWEAETQLLQVLSSNAVPSERAASMKKMLLLQARSEFPATSGLTDLTQIERRQPANLEGDVRPQSETGS